MGTSAEMSTNNTYVKYNISVTQNSQSISGNYSNVSVSVRFYRTNSGYQTYGTGTIYCEINGTIYYASVTSSQKITNSGITLFSKTFDILHNSDGSKTLTCSAMISMDVLSSSAQSYSQALTTIPRAATISDADNFTDEQNPRVWFSNPGGFKLRFTIDRAGGSPVYATRDVTNPSSPYTFSFTTAERNAMRQANANSNTDSCGVRIETFLDGSNPTNGVYVVRTLTIFNANPTFTSSQLSYQDTNSAVSAITGNNQQIVQNQSNLQISFSSATALKYASISSYQIIFNGQTQSKSSSGTYNLGIVNSSQSLTLQVKAIDSRGNSTTISKTITFLAWQIPQISYTIARVNNFENTTNILANVSISSVNGKNSLQILQYRTKQTTSSSWNDWSPLTNAATVQADFDNNYAWNFQIQAQDQFATATIDYVLNKGKPLLFFDTDKISVGVNTFPNNSNSFEATNLNISGTSTFASTVNINSTLNLSTTAKNSILNYVYPVGAIYMSINSTNPSSLFGGTWASWGTGRVPVGVNTNDSDFNLVEETGGSKNHRHAWRIGMHWFYGAACGEGVPSGTGAYRYSDGGYDGWNRNLSSVNSSVNNGIYNNQSSTQSTPGGKYSIGDTETASVLQPYITCYMWKRTA
jgi:hypothetical protein